MTAALPSGGTISACRDPWLRGNWQGIGRDTDQGDRGGLRQGDGRGADCGMTAVRQKEKRGSDDCGLIAVRQGAPAACKGSRASDVSLPVRGLSDMAPQGRVFFLRLREGAPDPQHPALFHRHPSPHVSSTTHKVGTHFYSFDLKNFLRNTA